MFTGQAASYRHGVPRKPSRPVLQVRLASALLRERARKGWTQEEAAEACGLNIRHYQKLEEGSVNTTLHTVERLSLAFDMDASRLLSGS